MHLLYSVQHTQGHSSAAIMEQSSALVSLPISHSEPWQYPGGRQPWLFPSAKALTLVSALSFSTTPIRSHVLQDNDILLLMYQKHDYFFFISQKERGCETCDV